MATEIGGKCTTAETPDLSGVSMNELENTISQMEKPWRMERVLRELYHKRGMTQEECSQILGCCTSTVDNWMVKLDIDVRSGAEKLTKEEIKVTEKHHDIIEGLLMGDGTLSKRKGNPCLTVNMITKEYLEWLDGIFGNLSLGVRLHMTAKEKATNHRKSGFNPKAKAENYHDIYTLPTRQVQDLRKYNDWYSTGRKVWPENVSLTPETMRAFYCGDGSMKVDRRNSNRRPYIRFRADNENENKEKVIDMFSRAGFEVKWPGDDIHASCDESERIWEYMGSPPPGFEYKWPGGDGRR